MRVALFDYGVGNLHSLEKALARSGARVVVTDEWNRALTLDALVLPGVGAFQAAVRSLPEDKDPIRRALLDGLPCLGICLGMQLLFDRSAEGEGEGIGLVPGTVRRLRASVVPQMGWNDMTPVPDDRVLGEPAVVYYANSFVCEPDDPGVVRAWTTFEQDRFAAGVRIADTWGVQFHPEKSSTPGLALIERFLEFAGRRAPRSEAPR